MGKKSRNAGSKKSKTCSKPSALECKLKCKKIPEFEVERITTDAASHARFMNYYGTGGRVKDYMGHLNNYYWEKVSEAINNNDLERALRFDCGLGLGLGASVTRT